MPVFILLLNDMRSLKFETLRTVARANSAQRLLEFIAAEKVEAYQEEYDDVMYTKSFKKGGPLEWFNSPVNEDDALKHHIMECGDRDTWTSRAGIDWDNKIGALPDVSYIVPPETPMDKKTAYISGHLDITVDEYMKHYHSRILEACRNGHNFVVGDARGVDTFAQQQLATVALPGISDVTVYHMFDNPRNFVSPPAHPFSKKGGFKSDKERDAAMTAESDYDIAWVRPGREKSGTARNLKRRERVESTRDVQNSLRACGDT